jgi:hypothetical protein
MGTDPKMETPGSQLQRLHDLGPAPLAHLFRLCLVGESCHRGHEPHTTAMENAAAGHSRSINASRRSPR